MVLVPVTIFGGLPVIASVSYGKDADTPNGPGEYWADVDALYWCKRNGSPGKEVSQRILDRLDKEAYWQAYVTEQADDWLSYNCPTQRRNPEYKGYSLNGTPEYIEEGDWSEEYILLNGDPRARQVSAAAIPNAAPGHPTNTSAIVARGDADRTSHHG